MASTPQGPQQTASSEAALVRGIGFWALAASVINNTVGGTIFALPSGLAKAMGPSAPLAFVLGALVFVPIALCFSAAGSRIHATGGAYSYVTSAFGQFPGFLVAALLWISNVAADGGIAAALADQLRKATPAFDHTWVRNGIIVAALAILATINARGVKVGARAVMVFATVKLMPLFALATLGWFWVHPANLHVAHLPDLTTVGGSMVLVIFAYSGMETALLPSGEVADPSRVVPRATLAAIGLVVLLYVSLQAVAWGLVGPALAMSTAPLATAAGAITPALFGALILTASLSQFGFLHNDLLGSSRLLYAMGRDGYLPSALARVTPTHRVPAVAIFVHAAIGCALGIAGDFAGLATVSGGATCLVYLGVCAAAWWLQRRGVRGEGEPFRLHGGPMIPLIGCAGLLLVLSTLQRNEWQAIGWSTLIVLAIYAVLRWNARRR